MNILFYGYCCSCEYYYRNDKNNTYHSLYPGCRLDIRLYYLEDYFLKNKIDIFILDVSSIISCNKEKSLNSIIQYKNLCSRNNIQFICLSLICADIKKYYDKTYYDDIKKYFIDNNIEYRNIYKDKISMICNNDIDKYITTETTDGGHPKDMNFFIQYVKDIIDNYKFRKINNDDNNKRHYKLIEFNEILDKSTFEIVNHDKYINWSLFKKNWIVTKNDIVINCIQKNKKFGIIYFCTKEDNFFNLTYNNINKEINTKSKHIFDTFKIYDKINTDIVLSNLSNNTQLYAYYYMYEE